MDKRPVDETNILYYYWLPGLETLQVPKKDELLKSKENKEK